MEEMLSKGSALCGWVSRIVHNVGLPASGDVPIWTEGEIRAGDLGVLVAWWDYFVTAESPTLAKDWHFARDGKPTLAMEEGYGYVSHPFLRVRFRGARTRAPAGAEARLDASTGTLAVRAESVLTRGKLPVYAAKPMSGAFDGYRFSAVRAQ
jgi:hypothetical protein